jgi:hypothetical protein
MQAVKMKLTTWRLRFAHRTRFLESVAGHFIKANEAGRLRRTARGCGAVSSGRGAWHGRWMGGGNGLTGMAGLPV